MENYLEQMSIFDDIIPKFKIKNKIRLIEFFGGIGAQARSLEIIGASFEHHRLVEWAYNSYCSYNAIHQKDFTDYSVGKSKEEMIQRIKGTSTNYNEPLTLEQLNKKPIEWIKNAYNNCIATNNLINIMDVHAEDLGITEQDKYTYIVCYSFPCQDLSMAGKRAGMSVSQADGGSRSGLLWEVERILGECKEKGCLPQCLLLENVPQVMDYKNVKDWRKWVARLEELGYSNFADVLNAKDFGLPQNRKRCFMVSILGEWNYKMPKKMHLDYRLKDMLEKNVDEKYYLSEKMIEYVSATGTKDFSVNNSEINCKIARPLTTEQNKRAGTTNYIADGLPDNTDLRNCKKIADLNYYNHEQSNRVYDATSISPTITTGHDDAKCIKIGFIEKGTGEHQSNSVYDEKGLAPTLSASDSKELVKILKNKDDSFVSKKYKEFKEKNGFVPEMFNPYNKQEIKDVSPTITTQCGSTTSSSSVLLKVGNYGNGHHAKDVFDTDGVSPTITTGNHGLGQAIAIKNATEKGYLLAEDGDGVDISTRMEHHRGTVQKGTAQTITTSGGENVGVVVKDKSLFSETEKELFTKDGNIKRYLDSDIVDKFEEGQMATTTYPNGYGHGTRVHNESIALNTIDRPVVKNNLRIRKLTPCECLKLMGFSRDNYQSLKNINMGDGAIYHMAGDSICTTVLCGIFSNLVNEDEMAHIEIIKNYVRGLINE